MAGKSVTTSNIAHAAPLSVQAADILRARILRGELGPGERINEVEFATSLGISRSPLREGLRTLAEEGLLRLVNGRGVFVASFDIDETRELLEVRQELDALAVRLAAERASDADFDRLAASMEDVTSSHSSNELGLPWFSDFHIVVFEIAGNSKLREHGIAVHTQLRLARFRSGSTQDRPQQANAEHQAILEALRTRDAAKAEKMARQHHQRGAAHILQTIADATNVESST